jgi:hypothetical protein
VESRAVGGLNVLDECSGISASFCHRKVLSSRLAAVRRIPPLFRLLSVNGRPGTRAVTHADCLRIIIRAETRIADEIEKGQANGEVRKPGRYSMEIAIARAFPCKWGD